MRLLFATGRIYLPERTGGAEQSVHALLHGLRRRGHTVEAVAQIGKSWRRLAYRGLRAISRRRALALPDRANGYPTWRTWEQLLPSLYEQRIARFRPELVLTQLEGCAAFATAAIARGLPVVVRFPDPSLRWLDGTLPSSELLATIANSRDTASRIGARLGITPEIIHPILDLGAVRARSVRPGLITFINPVADKGLDLGIEIARALPGRRFQFVEAWPLGAEALAGLRARLASLPQVSFRRWSLDVRPVYARTSVLLVPSRCAESFPRVILEAHANAIPVLARDDGGISEALGDGGVLLPADAPAAAWVAEIERLLDDPARFASLSAAAAANLRRPDLEREAQLDRFLALAGRLVEAARRGAP